jgi:hypothetical protein
MPPEEAEVELGASYDGDYDGPKPDPDPQHRAAAE